MIKSKILFLILSGIISSYASNAQSSAYGNRSVAEIKQNYINHTFKLVEIRNDRNYKVNDTISNKKLYFTLDSVYLTMKDDKASGVWLDNSSSFTLETKDGKKLKFDLYISDETSFCLDTGNKNRLECYKIID